MSHHPRWTQLVEWLDIPIPPVSPRKSEHAGYALVADKKIDANQALFTIHADKILNIKTLNPLYPNNKLSAAQLISLHLLLNRKDPSSAPFGAYIATLPEDFGFHPLSWLLHGSERVSRLPPSYTASLDALLRRFNDDWTAVLHYMTHFGMEPQPGGASSYIWAWLCVNTRCIFHQLKNTQSHPDNLSLVPILDFANHTSSLPSMIPQPASVTNRSSGKAGSFTLCAPANSTTVTTGTEMYLKYGSRCNRVLFVEYGFALRRSETEEPPYEVIVDDIVEALFEEKGDIGHWAKAVLENENYWKDYTLHVSYPSYRLVTALRLYTLIAGLSEPPNGPGDGSLAPWLATVTGQSDQVSTDNEAQWKNILLTRICQPVISRADVGLKNLDEEEDEDLKVLWEEERYVAQCICESIENGDELT